MKIITCTPVDFRADAHFFGRDSGLMCRGFQAAGHECRVVMPGVARVDDVPDLLRATPESLRCSGWWKDLNIDAALLYAWGDPTYLDIAQAIRAAGIRLIQNLDSAGIESPYANVSRWCRSLGGMVAGPQSARGRMRLAARAIRDLFPGIYERGRLDMMNEADFLAAVSPPAETTMREYARSLGFPTVADKLITLPHPVSLDLIYGGFPKQRRVLCVGRWQEKDIHQKDPEMLLHVLHRFLDQQSNWSAEIIGSGAPELLATRAGRPLKRFGDRLILTSRLDRTELCEHYAAASIHFCPSRFESFHISSAEALCCGCSIVVGKHPLLASTAWFTTRNSGTLAASRREGDLLAALLKESRLWDDGSRSASAISATWSAELHADMVARRFIQLLSAA